MEKQEITIKLEVAAEVAEESIRRNLSLKNAHARVKHRWRRYGIIKAFPSLDTVAAQIKNENLLSGMILFD